MEEKTCCALLQQAALACINEPKSRACSHADWRRSAAHLTHAAEVWTHRLDTRGHCCHKILVPCANGLERALAGVLVDLTGDSMPNKGG